MANGLWRETAAKKCVCHSQCLAKNNCTQEANSVQCSIFSAIYARIACLDLDLPVYKQTMLYFSSALTALSPSSAGFSASPGLPSTVGGTSSSAPCVVVVVVAAAAAAAAAAPH